MWGHFIELSMRSTLAYLRSMDTGTLLFEPDPSPPHPGAILRPSFSLTSGPIVPSSLASPPPPVNVPNVAAYLLSICLSVSLFLTVSRQCSPADKVKHPRRNKLSRPWHFAQLMSTGHAINPPPNALITRVRRRSPCLVWMCVSLSLSLCVRVSVCVNARVSRRAAESIIYPATPLLLSEKILFLEYFSIKVEKSWSIGSIDVQCCSGYNWWRWWKRMERWKDTGGTLIESRHTRATRLDPWLIDQKWNINRVEVGWLIDGGKTSTIVYDFSIEPEY